MKSAGLCEARNSQVERKTNIVPPLPSRFFGSDSCQVLLIRLNCETLDVSEIIASPEEVDVYEALRAKMD